MLFQSLHKFPIHLTGRKMLICGVTLASCVSTAREQEESRAESPERVELPFPCTDVKFLCPDCTRTKRPRLHRILALLVSMYTAHTETLHW